MFPGKSVTPLIFSSITAATIFDLNNNYVGRGFKGNRVSRALLFQAGGNRRGVEARVREGGFLGRKSYLFLSPEYLPEKEIRIFDFFPKYQWEAADRNGWS